MLQGKKMADAIILKLLYFGFFILVSLSLQAQKKQPPFPNPSAIPHNTSSLVCGTDLFLNQLRKDPKYKAKEDQMNRDILMAQSRVSDEPIVLPVVFHIISQNPSGVPDQQILDALKDLNDAFSKRGKYASGSGVDTKIQFCLAHTDPEGGISTGITRTTSFFSQHLNPVIEDDRLKNLIQWDPNHFINIWYVTNMELESMANFQCGRWIRLSEAGYATMPPGGGPLDGIVVSGFGNLLIETMGHYLGLYHTYEIFSCQNNDCTTDGDKVCDTPPVSSIYSSPSCSNPGNSCSTDTLSGFTKDVPDMITNFMENGNESCHNAFTKGQAERMRAAITTQRSGLLQNKCDKPCTENSIANFVRDKAQPLPGDVINFTNHSTGAAHYQWLVDDAPVSAETNFSYSFNKTGKYKVTLKAYNTTSCYATYTDFIIVTCGVTGRFYSDKSYIASKYPLYADSIHFINTSEKATSFQWLMRSDQGMAEQVVSTNTDLVYVFPTPGNYFIRLIATNGSCTDTTETFPVTVLDPTQDGVVYISDVTCYQQTKVKVSLFVCNYGYAPIPPKTPITFYDSDPRQGNAKKLGPTFYLPDTILGHCCGYLYTHIIDAGRPYLNQLYAVFNDSGNTMPLQLPNTNMPEKDFNNNVWFANNFAFRVTVHPTESILEPEDTVQLSAQSGPNSANIYTWSTAHNLSCTRCAITNFIADSTTTKQVIANSLYGCTDTGYVVIKVPPANDYTIHLDAADCAAQDKLLIRFTLANQFKRGILPKGLTVAFYNGDPSLSSTKPLLPIFTVSATVHAKQATFNTYIPKSPTETVYAVVNDNGTATPVQLPNTTWLEKDYKNNISSIMAQPYQVTANPQESILEPGDTLQLVAQASPDTISSYIWSSGHNLSCTKCQSTFFIADSTTTKQVVGKNSFGCTDTAFVTIKVPPADDYTVAINDLKCAAHDSLYLNFTLTNHFKRGIIPKGLTVTFYNNDPNSSSAALLLPIFKVPATVPAKQASYSFRIKGKSEGTIYAVVNDNGTTLPLQLPNHPDLLEKEYGNNTTSVPFTPETVRIQPADTIVYRKSSFSYAIASTVYNPNTTIWPNGDGYTINCNSCNTPVVTVYNTDTVLVQTANQYGCLIKGTATIKIFPPDMTLTLLRTNCYSNNTTRVVFKICMNNNYDSIFAKIPVSFYDSDPSNGGAHLLNTTFYTPSGSKTACDSFVHIVTTPNTGQLHAVVNDKGTNVVIIPDKLYDETDDGNNTSSIAITPFQVLITPADTSVQRFQNVLLTPKVNGGTVTSYLWRPTQFLSCSNCFTPVVTPPYTVQYQLIVQNEYHCIDTAYAIVKTFTDGLFNIPNAFTPNKDGKNDVFYILGSLDVKEVREFSIYNRWGERVFFANHTPANDPQFGWDGNYNGQPAPPEVYVYFARVMLTDGKEQIVKGTVMLVR